MALGAVPPSPAETIAMPAFGPRRVHAARLALGLALLVAVIAVAIGVSLRG